jgi:hypothetical protein
MVGFDIFGIEPSGSVIMVSIINNNITESWKYE